MKKICSFLLTIALLFTLQMPVYAADGNVSTLEATATTSAVTVSGTTDTDIAAVMVEVLDGTDALCYYSLAVDSNKAFSGTISGLSLTAGNTYTVQAADYDGGSWKSVSVTAKSASTSGSASSSSDSTSTTVPVTTDTTKTTDTTATTDTTQTTDKTKTTKKTSEDQSAEALKEMPAEDETKSEVQTNESGEKVVTESITVGTESLVVNEKGEVTISEETVASVKESISNALANTEDDYGTPQVVIALGVGNVIPSEIFAEAKGKNVDIVIQKDGYSWIINGNDIDANQSGDINFEVNVGVDAIPSDQVQELAKDQPTVQLSLSYDGAFGFKATLNLELGDQGKSNIGKYGNLYYNSENGLEFQCSGVIQEDGSVLLDFTHASDYVIVIGEDATPAEALATEGTVSQTEVAAPEEDTSEATSIPSWKIVIPIAIVLVGVILGVVLVARKPKEEDE